VSNHQNCLLDPLGVLLAFNDRKPSVLARADVFSVHRWVDKLLRNLGLLPAFRLHFDGEASLRKNRDMLAISEKTLINGQTLLIYPEGKHQDKHWLGDFSLGYTRLAFEAAESDDFKTEVFILPCCNHYSAYNDIRNDVMLKFGTPISIMPFYELYKTKPRTAQREVNVLVKEQMLELMLHISDLDNYKAIDFLRHTYGCKYAQKQGFRPGYLPEKLLADQRLVKNLEKARTHDVIGMQELYEDVKMLDNEIKRHKIRDDHFDDTPKWSRIILSVTVMICLFPVWLLALWPNILIYKAPVPVMRRVKDKMFYDSFLFGMSVMVTIPVLNAFTFVGVWIVSTLWLAAIYALLLPYLGLFAWYYRKYAVRAWQDLRFHSIKDTEAIQQLKKIRMSIHERLNNILK
jgi:1-acyl-sn-glycerol-3-phosphate acyltransferase